jgi:pyridinium-3,5-bisthiocarboxylic acid mononucleotide nickel chelatase
MDNTPSVSMIEDFPQGLHAHWDCFSGAAGDMMLAACLDAADVKGTNDVTSKTSESKKLLQKIEQSIRNGLPELANEFSIDCKRVWRGSGSITAMHVTVQSIYNHKPAPIPRPDVQSYESTTMDDSSFSHKDPSSSHVHDHHRHDHEHNHNHDTGIFHTQNLEPINVHGSSVHDHFHSHDHATNIRQGHIRNLPEIRQMLMDAPEDFIPKWVRENAINAFTELAVAEATVHGAASMNDVHFHEVGAVDSIVDTVGTLLALYYLNVKSVSCSRLPLGEGMVSTAHGILPVPAPATLHLMIGMPTTSGPPGRTGELVTPTAASLFRVLVQQPNSGRPPCMTLRKVGIGAGTKDFVKHPNIIRLLLGEIIDGSRTNKSN